jgi:2-keto-4-pentenoate hydratase/2-oxohepta-3-ene-1,7-dioic acid hydratase in catechol pathway
VRIARVAHAGGVDYAIAEPDSYRLIENPFSGGPPRYARHGRLLPAEDVRLLAPVEPRTVLGMAHNTGPADRQLPPEAFLKPARSVIGSGETIELPLDVGRVDAEAEVAAVIGTDGTVFGWTLANDVTARDLQATDARWARAKGYRTFTPCGPFIETDLDPDSIEFELVLDGHRLGLGDNENLARGAGEVLDYVRGFVPLGAQDLVLLGAPGPFGPLHAHTIAEIRSPQLGTLSNPVRATTGVPA